MIIGIDISSIPYGTGVSNYTLNLVKNLLKIDRHNQYKLFFSSLRRHLPEEIKKLPYPNLKIYHFKIPPSFLNFTWNYLHILPVEFFIGKCDIFHASDWTQPPSLSAKTVTTVHDLVPLLYPQWSEPNVVTTHRRKMYWVANRSSLIICVSQNTQDDLLRLFPNIKKEKTTVIYEAAEKKYHQFRHLSPRLRLKKIRLLKSHYDLNSYLLAQGTREPRKNLDRLIDAFLIFKSKYPKSNLQLAIAGKYGWGRDIKQQHPDIKILGFVDEKDMVALHAAAFCLIYPSLYEGFGLPIIKSFKVGTPVITSNTSSLPEISQDAALLVNPKSTESIASAITKIYRSRKLCVLLKRRGFKIARRYSWIKTVRQTLKNYRSLQ